MPTPPLADELALAAVEAVRQHGTVTAAANALGIPPRTFDHRYKIGLHRQAIAKLGKWSFSSIPGFGITKVSTNYSKDGEVTQEWVQQKPEAAEREAAFKAFVEALIEPIKGLSPLVKPPQHSDTDLLALYPIGDHHFGMRADGDETGDAYDCTIAEARLLGAVDRLVASAPDAETGLLLNLGDFYHANDSKDATPESGNRLDVDTRFGQVMHRGGMLLVRCVLRLLEKHERVIVWNMRGNHDPDAAMALAMAVSFYFHNEPRVTVDLGASLYKYHRFGANLIASHHGHGAKGHELPLIMAVDRPADWAATRHRVWHCGHIHHRTMKDHPGVDVETHRTLAGPDAWHAGKGYRSRQDMSVITYHREFGEVQRTRFDLGMLREAA